MFSSEAPHQALVNSFLVPPPKGTPESVAIPGTEKPDRSPVYRHWKIGSGELMQTLDPKVGSFPPCVVSFPAILFDIIADTGARL
jgi:long-chain acyl-CoA synthetase